MLIFLIALCYYFLVWKLFRHLDNKVAALNLDVHRQMKPLFMYAMFLTCSLVGSLFLSIALTDTTEPLFMRIGICLFSIVFLTIMALMCVQSVYMSRTHIAVISKTFRVKVGARSELIKTEIKSYAGTGGGGGDTRYRFTFNDGTRIDIFRNQLMDETLLLDWYNSARLEG
ncbi:hypothetical protein JCM19232_1113 [Vibrio ishigakensis]|uniref:Uncharacterized protein n=1 Tax=Vibrio ishigakensis TaxID=1481914 RepID=A0A0B8PMT8_9VIBR|nr:hypothetical protein JCM19232_1113 [Vibrio ishigakensis]